MSITASSSKSLFRIGRLLCKLKTCSMSGSDSGTKTCRTKSIIVNFEKMGNLSQRDQALAICMVRRAMMSLEKVKEE